MYTNYIYIYIDEQLTFFLGILHFARLLNILKPLDLVLECL